MSVYKIEIDGSMDLGSIEVCIASEEAVGSLFIESSIQYYDGRVTNIAIFQKLSWGERPKTNAKLAKGNSVPSGVEVSWKGVMVVSGTNSVVTLYRV